MQFRTQARDSCILPAMRITTLALLAALVAPLNPAQGQGTRLADEGSFTVRRDGRTAVRENFRVTATTRGNVTEYFAKADVTLGDRRLEPELRTDARGAVIEYHVKVRTGDTDETWNGVAARGRLNATITGPRGTAARELMVPPGALVLDEDVIHQHWFLTLRGHEGRLPILVPRRDNAQSFVTLAKIGEETLQVGTQDVPAIHIRVTDTGGEVRNLWIDRAGRLLKVEIPSRGLVAVRDDPPRG